MMRDDQQDYQQDDDPEAAVRARILAQQGGGEPPPPTEDPVYAPPPDVPAPPTDQGVTPWSDNSWQDPGEVQQPQAPWQPEAPAPTDAGQGAGGGGGSTSVGADIPWNPGASAPSSSPAGYHWDPNMANFVPDAPAAPAPQPTPTQPSGGNLTNPSYAAQLVAWAGTQPGVNPSVRNDPNYWIGRFTSGAFGNDQAYAIQRMMQAEGAPEGAGPAKAAPASPATTIKPATGASAAAPQAYSFPTVAGQQAPQGQWNSDFVAQIRQLLMERLSAAGQPVDPNDPNIAGPLTAARDESTRASDKERTALAENLYANGGLNTDAISQKIQQSGESNAQGLSTLRAQLMTRELQSRKDELTQLMQMALASGDAESARAIQMQIAALSAEVNREGMDLDAGKYAAYLNQNAVLAGLNG